MSVLIRCEEAKMLLKHQMYNAALILLLVAVSGASEVRRKEVNGKKKFPGDDRKYFLDFLNRADERFSDTVFFLGKPHQISLIFCKYLRCDLFHEAKINFGELNGSMKLISIDG
ncbi:hypothetical protein [Sulfitobacter sp. AS59]|uniref:hypothetical protein n=1 Tax=Sulfitobacter sp. AS59 TaxID=3135784 RepID=UPI00316D124C